MTEFEWTLHPQAEALVDRLVADAIAKSPVLSTFSRRLAAETSTRLQDWLDTVAGPVTIDELFAVGYRSTEHPNLWRHPGAQLPALIPADHYELGLRTDDVATFAALHGRVRGIEGSALSGYRRVLISQENAVRIIGIERRSWAAGHTPQRFSSAQSAKAEQAWQLLADRPRQLDGASGVGAQLASAREAVRLVGPDLAASYFLQQERQYWQARNAAGAAQHARQDALGLGWGNNDHHTFRSSRSAFGALMEFLTALGFGMRERFYAGAEAGWGAQVIEHPGCGGVIFADVDLRPDEVELDFAHSELADQVAGSSLGTVGMWCALHGESLLGAGMHHLEGQFSFEQLTSSLADLGHSSMRPFSDFDHLRQAFTEAEWWSVPQDRLAALVANGELTADRAGEISMSGAAGSHLENLARRGGFKGFNQQNVSVTMAATHPRDYRRQAG
ncbi:MAG: hypothetical protein M3Y42_20390 [Actinomycetota bacterium]|nr:hypothetical protein [Actinomycetota bacterium]MDQ2959305.1 hypothetical protein [Actinomycetota bacterium]